MKPIQTHNLGFPRVGEKRELKLAVEAYWKGESSRDALEQVGSELRRRHWRKQAETGMDWVPCGDFSFYDHVLDTSCMLGNVPERFGWRGTEATLDTKFAIARGVSDGCCGHDTQTLASEMTKWFDTNYHYIVPEFSPDSSFGLSSSQIIKDFNEAGLLGISAKPVLLGPVSYLRLGKVRRGVDARFSRFSLFERVLPVYMEVLKRLSQWGAQWVQFDEPILALDLTPEERELLVEAYARLKKVAPHLQLMVASYFGELRENLDLTCNLACDGLHIDAVRAPHEVELVVERLPSDRVLSLGIVDGRNVWINDMDASLRTIASVRSARPDGELWLAPSCSLLHVPTTLRHETKLDPEVKSWLAFAEEKLVEVAALRDLAEGKDRRDVLEANRLAWASRRTSSKIHRPDVQTRSASISPGDYDRHAPFRERQVAQRARFNLPQFPTTTIGSFPQTKEVRSLRARLRSGHLSQSEYARQIAEAISDCVQFQEEIGLDVLVHGEFERNDMVEYFGEQLDGFVFTNYGWVQSYGSRCVKPPIIFGDVARPRPMTTEWTSYAQSLTNKPVKGMLTGPVTILQWSFVRDDQPRSRTAQQIALAVRDEVLDLERSGIGIIQIDEPALREGLPLRHEDWRAYLSWAVGAFRLSAAGVADQTQIHTHMCYSEFNDIISAIADMDADVITIETSRSNLELLDAFAAFRYAAEIGPGVYDIHSPRIPESAELELVVQKALEVLPKENLWINPDCGLKTRGWPEVRESLRRMVDVAVRLRGRTSDLVGMPSERAATRSQPRPM